MKQYYRVHFERLVEYEPELLQLEYECKILRQWHEGSPKVCGNAMWYGWGPYRGIRPRMVKLVGYEVIRPRHQIMRKREGYDIARGYLYNLLPDCVHDGLPCLAFGRAQGAPESTGKLILVCAADVEMKAPNPVVTE